MYFRELPASSDNNSAPFHSATLGVYKWAKQRVAERPGLMVDALAGPDTADGLVYWRAAFTFTHTARRK